MPCRLRSLRRHFSRNRTASISTLHAKWADGPLRRLALFLAQPSFPVRCRLALRTARNARPKVFCILRSPSWMRSRFSRWAASVVAAEERLRLPRSRGRQRCPSPPAPLHFSCLRLNQTVPNTAPRANPLKRMASPRIERACLFPGGGVWGSNPRWMSQTRGNPTPIMTDGRLASLGVRGQGWLKGAGRGCIGGGCQQFSSYAVASECECCSILVISRSGGGQGCGERTG
jgi:hypothetical protein